LARWIPGAVQLVECGGEPAVVSDKYIRLLKEYINTIVHSKDTYLKDLQHGDLVRIKQGAFAGYEALFDSRLKGQDRVQVLLHWLGCEVRAKVSVDVIENKYRR
jgi:transcription antitermination factor NusG